MPTPWGTVYISLEDREALRRVADYHDMPMSEVLHELITKEELALLLKGRSLCQNKKWSFRKKRDSRRKAK